MGITVAADLVQHPGVKAGCLDDPSWVEVVSSFWSASAHGWSPVDDAHAHFRGNPEAPLQ